jgi:hypothetical protein
MLKAVREVCSADGGSPARSGRAVTGVKAQWFCDTEGVRFFRGVDVLGNRQRTGLVCGSERVTPNLRYYTEDMFGEDAGCVPIAYEVATRRHVLETEETK